MPATWTAEADAKLFLGVIKEVKAANFNLNHDALAKHMGSDCTASAVRQHINKLVRGSPSRSGATDESPVPTPTKKRKAGKASQDATPKKAPKVKKGAKKEATGEDEEAPKVEDADGDGEDMVAKHEV